MSAPTRTTIEVTLTVKVDVPEDWIHEIVHAHDFLTRGYCGYWARGVERDDERGWLIYVDEYGDGLPPKQHALGPAIEAWKAGQELPAGFYRWDRDFAIKAFAEGVKWRGTAWYDSSDALGYDYAIQMALFGKVRFG